MSPPLIPSRILVVHEKELIARAIADMVTAIGYKAHYSHTAEDAIDKLQIRRYRAVITDFRLPDVNGLDVVREAQKLRVRVIGMSDYPDDERHFTRYSVPYFLARPFREDQLLAAVSLTMALKV